MSGELLSTRVVVEQTPSTPLWVSAVYPVVADPGWSTKGVGVDTHDYYRASLPVYTGGTKVQLGVRFGNGRCNGGRGYLFKWGWKGFGVTYNILSFHCTFNKQHSQRCYCIHYIKDNTVLFCNCQYSFRRYTGV